MSTLLFILMILTIPTIVWLLVGVIQDNEKNIWGPLLFLLIIIFTGWFLLGIILPQKTKKVKANVDILKGNIVVADDGEKLWGFREYKDVLNINDSTKFYYEIDCNIYGFEVERKLKYKN